ncbi:MAG: hypothetical protein JRG95_06925 [Deltaproteobacteria bacterium]|nr:hypothetical protein [Deltaproteobacteria bacterium]
MGQHAASEIRAELALDEARHRLAMQTSTGQEGLELHLDDCVEDTVFGAVPLVAPPLVAAPSRAELGIGSCERAHACVPLPAPYQARFVVSAPLAANSVGIEAICSRFRR